MLSTGSLVKGLGLQQEPGWPCATTCSRCKPGWQTLRSFRSVVSRSREVILLFFRQYLKYCELPWELLNKRSLLKVKFLVRGGATSTEGKYRGTSLPGQWWILRSAWAVLFNITQRLWKLLWFQYTHARGGWKTWAWAWSWAGLFFVRVNDDLNTGKTHKLACVSSPKPSTCFSSPYHPGS